MSQRNFSFKNIICLLGGIQAFGFAEDEDAISIERIEDVATLIQGADGWGVVTKSAATGFKATIKLLGISPFNAFLQSSLTTMDATGLIVPIPFFLKDVNGADIVQANQAIISKAPVLSYGKSSMGKRVWEFLAMDNITINGGHPVF